MKFSSRPKPVVLLILDGWGISSQLRGNAIAASQTPNLHNLMARFPHTTLIASGESVGLPKGEDGNTETGHLNIGAGKIVYQDLPRINQAIADGSFFHNHEFIAAIDHARKHNSSLHLLGLIGSGGVHSSIDHLYALLNLCQQQQFTNVALHLITDGRDSPPTSGINYVTQIKERLNNLNLGHIATVMGRYYAMDRDRRWDRTEIAYQALTQGVGQLADKADDAILASYRNNCTDEFIQPIILRQSTGQLSLVRPDDAVIFYNFRIDRPRQLTRAFVHPNLAYVNIAHESFDPYAIEFHSSHLQKSLATETKVFDRGPLLNNLFFVTMTEYEKGLPVRIAFPLDIVAMPLGRVVAEMGLRQLRMAETEKERFVTYYFNGQREDPFPGEDRIIIPSPPVPTYDQKPQMSAAELTHTLVERIRTDLYDLIIVNFANADMVAHTGNFQAAITACEFVDTQIGAIVDPVLAMGGLIIITADHGNAEEMINLETGGVDTEHSTFPVPFIIAHQELIGKSDQIPQGILADIAPTIVDLMELPCPSAMTGRSLLQYV